MMQITLPSKVEAGDILRLPNMPREAEMPTGWKWSATFGWYKIVEHGDADVIHIGMREIAKVTLGRARVVGEE